MLANTPTTVPQMIIPGMRRMLYLASVLVFAVGIPLFLLSEQTEQYFAWTIQSPLTAAFLGGAYWSSCVLELLAAREALWSRARCAVPAVIAFTALTLVVTLVHLDRFHFGAPSLLTRAGTWVWLAVYASVPIIMAFLLSRQLRAPGSTPERQLPLPSWSRVLLWFNSATLIVLGCAMLLVPLAVVPYWPWALTALTARAIGAWLVGLGISAAHEAWENDAIRVRAALISAVVFSGLELIALARYASEPNWSQPQIWIYIGFLLDFIVVGGYGAWRAAQYLRAKGG